MPKIDMLSITKDLHLYISSTDIAEVKFFREALIEKFATREAHFRHILLSLDGYSLTYTIYSNTIYEHLYDKPETNKIYIRDMLWWLYQVALERGWKPFGEIGTFTRNNDGGASG